MTLYIAHRQNNLKNFNILKKLKFDGIEIDLRSSDKKIIINHDPFKKSLDFLKKIKNFKKIFLIIDIKSSGISFKIYKYLIGKKFKFLLLNLIQPEFFEMVNKGLSKNLFLRYSLYEKLNFTIKKINKIKWVWVDFFESYYIPKKDFKYLRRFKKKICLTSPDLVGKSKNEIRKYIKYLNKNSIKVDMVCVKQKNIGIWKKLYKY
tara:strand:- start:64 stop:678 length:615 start_codon:yes stop_codon:yes gene_type:complete